MWLPKNKTVIPKKLIEYGVGHCPFPTQTELDNYIGNYSVLIDASVDVLHTLDRHNLVAISEQVVMANNLTTNSTWASTVESHFTIEYWPFIQSNNTYTCVDSVMLNSPSNLYKLGALKGLVFSLQAVILGALLYIS